MNKFKIKKATENDIDTIIRINNSRTNRDDKGGFILDKYTHLETRDKFQADTDFFLIINQEDNDCVGFLEVNDKIDKRIPDQLEWYDTNLRHNFKNMKPKYIDRICITGEENSKGAGSFTYNELLKIYPNKSFYAFIVARPIENKASIIFHEKNGFKKVAAFKSNEYAGFKDYESQIFFKNQSTTESK